MMSQGHPILARRLADVPLTAWLSGLVVSLLLLGPGLGAGSLLNLDLVLVPEPPVPRGVWGLGPDLPRRVPMWVFVSWASTVISGDLVGKMMLIAGLTVAFAGCFRLTARISTSPWSPWGAAALYAFGPFLLTRAAIGHWMVLLTMALLPWALESLLAPHRSLRRTLWWSVALGVAGVYGGVTAGLVIAAGLIAHRFRRWPAVLGVFVVAQLPWLVPMGVVAATSPGGDLAGAASFRTPLDSLGDVGRVVAGQGFWNFPFQLGREQKVLGAVIGFVLLTFALAGVRELPQRLRLPLTALGGLSFVISVSSGIGPLHGLVDWFTATPFGAPFRDTHRTLALFVLWVAPTAAIGAARVGHAIGAVASSVIAALPLALAVVLFAPALWGFGGQLQPTRFPQEWEAARASVEADPGTLVAFPWFQYFTLDIADNRLVLNVVAYYFGGDVVSSSDPNLTRGREQERLDPRETAVGDLSTAALEGTAISSSLAELGVRWVALQHDVNWKAYTGVLDDPGLELVVEGDSLGLYRVTAWPGDVWTSTGRIGSSSPLSPVWSVDPSGDALWARPSQKGWLRGWAATTATDDGLIALPAGSGAVWFWPTLVVLAAYGLTLATVAAAEMKGRSRRATPPG